jgi:DsbC/DsbD-like thiol-disulfide interchange protein
MNKALPFFSLLVGLMVFTSQARAQEEHAHAELVADVSAIRAGEPFLVGVKFTIDPGWHIYWTNPGDSGLPTEVKLNLPDGFTAGHVQYPVPQRLQLPGDVINYAYENEVMLMMEVTPPKDLKEKSRTLTGKASWLVCKDECFPGSGSLSLDLPVKSSTVPDNTALFKSWTARLPLGSGAAPELQGVDSSFKHGKTAKDGNAKLMVHWAATPKDIQYLPDQNKGVDISDVKVETNGPLTTIKFAATGAAEDQPIHGLVTYMNKANQLIGFETTVTASEPRR